MNRYKITLNGCDDYTEFEMDLSAEELALVKRISAISEATSIYSCMPTLTVELIEKEDEHASITLGGYAQNRS